VVAGPAVASDSLTSAEHSVQYSVGKPASNLPWKFKVLGSETAEKVQIEVT
jgi:hypothetical protein